MSCPARVGRASDDGATIACAVLGAHCFDFHAYKKLVTIFLTFIAYVDRLFLGLPNIREKWEVERPLRSIHIY